MIKKQGRINTVLFIILLGIPLAAEYVTAKPDFVPGTGIDILLYEPFDFAYVLLAAILFISINVVISSRRHQSKVLGLFQGSFITIGWFIISFFAVMQLHLSLGGKL